MKLFRVVPLLIAMVCALVATDAKAKVDTVELFTEAVMTSDIPALEKILAPNFWCVSVNGHIADKEHFIAEIKSKKLVVDRLTLSNTRETKLGQTRLITANGVFHGKSEAPRPQGIMRYTMVLANDKGREQVVLFQATPVIPTADCKDGNCKIK